MNAEFAHVIAEEFVDWLLEPNEPDKESLALFSLGMTTDGIAVRNAILPVLRPMMISHEAGVYSSNFPREKLLRMAKQAIERMPAL